MAPKVKERVDGYLFSGSTPGLTLRVYLRVYTAVSVIVHKLLASIHSGLSLRNYLLT